MVMSAAPLSILKQQKPPPTKKISKNDIIRTKQSFANSDNMLILQLKADFNHIR